MRKQMLQAVVAAVGLALIAVGTAASERDDTHGDPFGSLQWPALKREYAGAAPVEFDSGVQVIGPRYAEDPLNVPIAVDATALAGEGGGGDRVVVIVDGNPIRKVLEFTPLKARTSFAFRFKLEQSSPVRALGGSSSRTGM